MPAVFNVFENFFTIDCSKHFMVIEVKSIMLCSYSLSQYAKHFTVSILSPHLNFKMNNQGSDVSGICNSLFPTFV